MPDASNFGPEYFNQVYRHYSRQNPPWKMAFYQRLVSRYAPRSSSPKILDMGCAFGRFLSHLDSNWRRFGIDLSEYAIRHAHQTAPEVGFAVASCTAVPFRGPFEVMVAFDVIEHVPDLELVARFVNGELSPDGAFAFVVPVYDGPLGWVVHALDRDPTHVHKKPRAFWLAWARSNFDLQEWQGVFRYLVPGGPYINWPTRALRGVAPALAVVVRRRR